MTRKFTFMILAMLFAILGPGAEAWGQAPVNTVLWGENFAHFGTKTPSDAGTGTGTTIYDNASITYTQSSTNTKGYNEKLAGGTAPELLLSKSNQTWTISGIKSGAAEEISLTFLSNKTAFSLTCSSDAYTVSGSQKSWTLTLGDGKTAPETFNITLKNTSSKDNARLDDVVLKVTKAGSSSTTPTCTIDPTSYDFGEIAIGGSAEYEFTVTTADLTGNLTLAVSEGFSVSPTTIESTETERTVTITCAPTAVGALDGTLTISGGGLTDDVTATLSATGLCTAPENELAYTTPVELQLTAGEAEATLAPIENTGNGGTITYELIAGDESHLSLDESTGEIYTDAIGSYTVRATQAVNGTICGGTFDIEINVTSTSPSCSISPSEWDFGNVAIGTPASKTFTVTTANLTGDLTVDLSMGETTYSVTPTTISQSATSTDVTVTFTPVEDGLVEELLTISGGGLTSAVEVVLSATGISPYTVTYVAVNGDAPQAAIVEQGSSITLGTVENVDCNTWQFAGWSESETFTEAPTLLAGGNYTPTENVTLYAVYKKAEASEPTQVPFVFADIAEANDWKDAQAYTSVVIDPVTITANGGGNNGKYYTSDKTWRMYNGGSVTITSTGNNITAVSSDPSTTFSINNGEASLNFNATTKFKSITVTCTPPTSFSYSTTPSCLEIVATPTITPNGGEFIGSQEITLACTTEGATISYTTDDWETSNTYSAPFTITATTTLKVKATKDGMSESEEASATFTKVPVLETMQAIFDASATAGNYYVTFNNWVVSGVKGSNAYVTDGTKGFIVYKSGHGFEAGNVISGTAQLALTRYNGAAEFTNLTSSTTGLTVTTGGSITPVEASIAALGGVNTGAVIKVNNVQYNGTNLVDENSNIIKPYNAVDYNPTFTNGLKYNVTGVYIQFNTTKEIAPRSADDIQLIVAAPTFTPEGGNYNAAQTVTITSATTGATIYYTLDNSNPTTGSTPYTDPIEISENTTIKAIAVKNGVSSEIATAVYNITITTVATPTFEPEDGSYFDEDLKVSLACATDGATIVYTTDDWSTQTPYSDPFTITETTTVKAKATKAAMDESEIAEATYTKRYKVDYVVNGDATAVASVYVTPGEAIGTLPTLDDIVIPTGFDFAGWSLSESSTTTIGETYIVNAIVTLYAVFSRVEGGTQGSGNYEKVTENLEDWSGDYLIAYSSEIFADGRTGGTDGLGKQYQKANPESNLSEDGNTVSAQWGDLYHVTLEKIDGSNTYLLKTQDGKYNYQSSNTNGLASTTNRETAAQYPITVKFASESEINLALGGSANGAVFRYNIGGYFRYYKNCGQSPVYFYKKDEGTPGNTKYYTRVQSISGNTEITTVTTADLITVPNGAVLTITGSCTGDPENLIIEDGGQLIVNNKGVQATMKKHIKNTPSRDDQARSWYTISSPLAASTEFANVTYLIPSSGVSNTSYDLYYLNEKDGVWVNARPETGQSSSFTKIDKGVGYIYSNAATTTIAFAGEVNVADVDVKLSLTADKGKGYNLIGNPFMQNITLDNVKSGGTAELAGGFYVLTNQDTWGAKIETGSIAPLQGFLVQATTAGDVTISKNVSSKGERSNEQNTNIEMIVSNASFKDNAYAMFGEGIGLNKVSHRNAEAPMLYVPQDGEDFAIAFMDENTTVFPVSFKAMTTGSYSISLKATDDISTLVLVDNMTGEETNMLLEDSYTFIGSPADNENRFTVKLTISHNDGQSDSEHFVYQNGSELVINGEGTLQIFDVLGRVVISEEVHGQTVNVGGLNTGAYIARLTGESVKTQKIVVR